MAVGAPQDDACRIPSTNQNFGRSPPLHRRAPNVSRAGSVGVPQRMSRGLPECSAVWRRCACDGHHEMSDLNAGGEPDHRATRCLAPTSDDAGWMEMMTM